MKPRFSIVLPCYNEAGTLPSLFEGFATALSGRLDFEVIFVNNGSRDDSSIAMKRELSRPGRAFARVENVEVNQGYGYGVLSGLHVARGDFVGWTHADSQYEPGIVIAGFDLLSAAENPSRSFVRGRRYGRGVLDVAFTAGMSMAASVALGARLWDINAQPKLFPRAFLDVMTQPPHDFSLDLYALFMARHHEFRIMELPVLFGPRLHGEAKGGGALALKWKLTKRTAAFIWKLRKDIHAARVA